MCVGFRISLSGAIESVWCASTEPIFSFVVCAKIFFYSRKQIYFLLSAESVDEIT